MTARRWGFAWLVGVACFGGGAIADGQDGGADSLTLTQDLPPDTIRSIEFTPPDVLPSGLLDTQLRTQPGALYSDENVDEDIRDLARKYQVWARFEPERLPDDTIHVRVFLSKRATIRSVEILGNDEIDDEEIREAVGTRRFGVLEQGVFDLDRSGRSPQIEQIRRRLLELYAKEGFLYPEVEVRRVARGEEAVLQIRIVEGPEVEIDEIEFEGLHFFDKGDLLSVIDAGESWILKSYRFQRDKIENDVVRIEQFLHAEGFLDAQAALKSVTLSESYEDVDLVFYLEQGDRYHISSISFEGNDSFPEEELRKLIRLEEGDPLRSVDFRKDQRKLLEFYGERGFIRAEVREKRVFSLDEPLVQLVFEIDEDLPKRVRDVRVVGNVNTADEVIRRELDIAPGDLFDQTELDAAADRLRASGFFAGADGLPRVQVYPVPVPDDPEVEDIALAVVDGQTGLLSFNAGVASGQGVFAGITIDKENFDITDLPSGPLSGFGEFFEQKAFHGAGQRLRMVLNPGTQRSQYSVTFVEPYFNGPVEDPISLETSAYWREQFFRRFDEARIGANVEFGKNFGRNFYLGMGLRSEEIEIGNVDSNDPVPDYLAAEGKSGVRSISGRIRLRDLDSLFNPTDGWSFEATAEFGGGPLGADVDMFKLWARGEYLIPLYENEKEQRHVLQLRGTVAYGTEHSGADSVPFFERFYAGGVGTALQIRGFDFRGMGPHQNGEEVGGLGATVINFDYVFPLLDHYQAKTQENFPFLRGVVWVDQGMLVPQWEDLSDGFWRFAAGVGLRLRIPVLLVRTPLELYYGIPFARQGGDDRQSFLLNFSTRF